METNIPNIYAIGECAEHQGMVHGLVQPIYEQASVLAKHLLGEKITHTPKPIYSTKLKVPDLPIYSAGCIEHHSPFMSAVTYLDEEQEVYKNSSLNVRRWQVFYSSESWGMPISFCKM